MIVVKWSDKVEVSGYNIDAPLCGELYKGEENSLVPWSVTNPYAKMNFFTWPKEENDWIFPGDQYNEEFKKWRGPIHIGKLQLQTLKDNRNTEETCSKYTGSAKFNGIPGVVNPEIPIKSYKDQWREHMIRNEMWDVFSLPYPCNKDKKWDLLLHQSRFFLAKWNTMYRVFRKALRQISMWFTTWCGNEYTWGLLSQRIFFRRHWHWWRW